MSLLSTFEVTPARLGGMYRFLARYSDGISTKDLLRAMMPPSTTKDKKDSRVIVERTLEQGASIRLWNVEDDQVHLNSPLDDITNHSVLTNIEAHLWAGDDTNDDLGLAIAWLLSRDPLDGAWTRSRVEKAVVSTRWADETSISQKERYGVLRDWAIYLGCAWALDHEGSPGLLPDPTSHLRRCLPKIINQPEEEVRFADFMATLGEASPVLDGGRFRDEIERESTPRPPKQVSASTAFALDRLQQEGTITLKEKADDPDPRVLKRGSKTSQVSHIIWHTTSATP